jgi:hypothetical protein
MSQIKVTVNRNYTSIQTNGKSVTLKGAYKINKKGNIAIVDSDSENPDDKHHKVHIKNCDVVKLKHSDSNRKKILIIESDNDSEWVEETPFVPDETSVLTDVLSNSETVCNDHCGIKNSYSPEEIKCMNDAELLSNFIRITGRTKLYCAHCKKETPLNHWIHGIRTRCLKKVGLSSEMKIPKTCDAQQSNNRLCNPTNNLLYPLLRKGADAQTINRRRGERLGELGKKIRPYKYI